VAAVADDRPLVAFVGPSLPADEARGLVPEVELLPPIRQGDLSTVVERANPRGVLIVDGEFGQSLSVWHKEILHALHLGIRVVGASSMGALRAAELDRYGMEGVGEIYAYYRDGRLTSDADVALLFSAADHYGRRPNGSSMLTYTRVGSRSGRTMKGDNDVVAVLLDAVATVVLIRGPGAGRRSPVGARATLLDLSGLATP
jgi:hypothetical protein